MTREEQIKLNADACASVYDKDGWDESSIAFGFEKGARWADAHPSDETILAILDAAGFKRGDHDGDWLQYVKNQLDKNKQL